MLSQAAKVCVFAILFTILFILYFNLLRLCTPRQILMVELFSHVTPDLDKTNKREKIRENYRHGAWALKLSSSYLVAFDVGQVPFGH